MTTRQLVQHAPAMPARLEVVPGMVNGVDVVMPHLEAVYHSDPDAPALLGSLDRGSSPSERVCFDQAILAQKVKAHAAKNGNNAMIENASLALLSRWISWAARRFGVARSQRIEQARQTMLAAQAGPQAEPAE